MLTIGATGLTALYFLLALSLVRIGWHSPVIALWLVISNGKTAVHPLQVAGQIPLMLSPAILIYFIPALVVRLKRWSLNAPG